jgi:hypothetical protein
VDLTPFFSFSRKLDLRVFRHGATEFPERG